MFLDAENQFSDAQAVTADAIGTNTIDLGVDRSIGTGEPMGVLFTVDVAASQTNSDEDYQFDLEYATDVGQTTGRQLIGRRIFEAGTPDAPAQNADLLVAGFQFVIPVPPTTAAEGEAYLGIRYDVTGTDPTITMTANLLPLSMIENVIAYPDGITIS